MIQKNLVLVEIQELVANVTHTRLHLSLRGYMYTHPACIYLIKSNYTNTRNGCEICSKLTIKTPKRLRGVILVPYC